MTITVNGREHEHDGALISFERIVELAGTTDQATVTWNTGDQGKSMSPGESVPVTDGMHFAAVITGNV